MNKVSEDLIGSCCYYGKINKEDKEIKWLSGGRQQGKTYQLIKDQQKEIERLNKELSLKTNYIQELLEIILKSDDFKMQKEVYEKGIIYDKELKELKEGK